MRVAYGSVRKSGEGIKKWGMSSFTSDALLRTLSHDSAMLLNSRSGASKRPFCAWLIAGTGHSSIMPGTDAETLARSFHTETKRRPAGMHLMEPDSGRSRATMPS